MHSRLFVSLMLSALLLMGGCSGAQGQPKALMPIEAAELAMEWAKAESVIRNGGVYEEGEYETFLYDGVPHRYLAKSVGTKKGLMAELQKTMTKKKAKRFMKENGIIVYKKRLIQPEREFSSDLNWDIATIRELKMKKGKQTVEITVPIGETRTAQRDVLTFVYVKNNGWKVHKVE